MSGSSYATQISVGDEVYGSDGHKVGTVAEVQASYIVVAKGLFFPTDYYIPLSAIASASAGQVYLTSTRDAALQSGWDVVPDVQAATMTTTTAMGEEEIRVPVMEEELTATVRTQEAGAVRIEKDVIEEERTLDVPVTEERVRVERRVVDRPVSATEAEAFEETVIEVPLRSETVEVQKQARVAEEVVVSKEAVARTERVTDTVRKEEVFIDDSAALIDDSEGGSSRST